MSWENRLTVGDLDDDNGDFEDAGVDGTDIETNTDWVKTNTSCEIDNEAGSGVNTYNGSDFCAKIHTATDDFPYMVLHGTNLDNAFTVGEFYEVSLDYKTLTGSKARFDIRNNQGVLLSENLTSESWTTFREVFQVVNDTNMQVRVFSHYDTDEDGTEVLWIDNISILPHRKRRIIGSGII